MPHWLSGRIYCIVLYCIVVKGLSDGARCLCGSGITGSYPPWTPPPPPPPIDSLIDVSHLWRWDSHAWLSGRIYCIVLYCIVGSGLSDGARCLCGSGITGSSPYPSQPDRRQPPTEMRWACLTGWAVVCIVLYCIVLYCSQWFEWWRTVSVWQRHHGVLSPLNPPPPLRQPDRRQPPREMRWACLTGWAVVCIVLYCIVGSGFSDGARCLCGSGITGSSPILVSLIDVSYLGRWGGPASLAEWSYVLYCIVL